MLPTEDQRHILAASGWIDLGLMDDAFAELENVAPEHRAHPLVLELRWEIFRQAKQWLEALEIARALMRLTPDSFSGYWMASFVLHELERTQDAFDNIMNVREKFADECILHYNGGCYLAQLGRHHEAREWLKVAFKLKPQQRLAALDDPDLEMFWTEIQRGGFKS